MTKARPLWLILVNGAFALFYDVLVKHAAPPAGGCMTWADAPAKHNAFWADGKPPVDAGSFCAQQARGSANKTCAPTTAKPNIDHGSICPTAYCVSALSGELEFCNSALGVPEQVNIQIAGSDAVVLQWITFEVTAPADAPFVTLMGDDGADGIVHRGVTHAHVTGGKRTYYMHFVRLEDLAPRARYNYTVQSGGAGAVASDVFSFRAPYASGETRIALYGDMGVYTWNNMANLQRENELETADLIIHAGDHCYNELDFDERRADGYMQAFEQTIANVPWMPVVGNHEFYTASTGHELSRYLDSTWQKWGPMDVAGDSEAAYGGVGGGVTSATTALGAFLSAGNSHGAGTTVSGHSVVSNTSRYFSVDFGLVHLVALSLNGYNGVDTCTDECNAAQVEWLKRDLAAVDRSITPWIVAMSHFPFYYRAVPLGDNQEQLAATWAAEDARNLKAPWNVAERCEYPDKNGNSHSKSCRPEGWDNSSWVSSGERADAGEGVESGAQPPIPQKSAISQLEPLFDEFGVDLYWAGYGQACLPCYITRLSLFSAPDAYVFSFPVHQFLYCRHIHFYQTFDGPVRNGKVLMDGTHNPTGTVHVCSGNGGPPSPSSCEDYCQKGAGKREWAGCKMCIQQPYSYTRLTAHNATDLLWEQVSNADNSIIDTWSIHQDKHGAFTNVTEATGYSELFGHSVSLPAYVQYNTSAGVVEAGYPRAYGNKSFPGIPAQLDAAVPHYQDGKSVYFFKVTTNARGSACMPCVLLTLPLLTRIRVHV